MKLSVIVTTYNHEKYISQALESVLLQKIDCPIEIIIGDDCSSDGTSDIIEDFRKRFPDIFVVLRYNKNIGVTENLNRCIQKSSGNYIGICEGDDYWTDEFKLAKQVKYLEDNDDCSMCFNKINLFYEDSGKYIVHPSQEALPKDKGKFITKDLINDNFIGNFSCCLYRKSMIDKLQKKLFSIYVVDWMFNMAIAQHGKIGFIDDVMSVYRIHNKGVWSGVIKEKKFLDWIKNINTYDKYFEKTYAGDFYRLKKKIYCELLHDSLKTKDCFKIFKFGFHLSLKHIIINWRYLTH